MRQVLKLIIFIPLILALPLEAAKLKTGKLVGKLQSTTYFAPNNLFYVEVPVSASVGGRIDDGLGNVTFVDDFGDLYRIDYIELPAEVTQQRDALGDKAFLEGFLTTIYLPNSVWLAIPKAKILSQDFSTGVMGPMLMSWMHLPNGSAYIVKKGMFDAGKREDSYRAIAVFCRKQTVYVVSSAPSGLQTGPLYKGTTAELRDKIQKQVSDFADNIKFIK